MLGCSEDDGDFVGRVSLSSSSREKVDGVLLISHSDSDCTKVY